MIRQQASAARDLDDILDLYRVAGPRRAPATPTPRLEPREDENAPRRGGDGETSLSSEDLDAAVEFSAKTIVLREDASPRVMRLLEAGEQFGHVLDIAAAEGTDEAWIRDALVDAGVEFREAVIETAVWIIELEQEPD